MRGGVPCFELEKLQDLKESVELIGEATPYSSEFFRV